MLDTLLSSPPAGRDGAAHPEGLAYGLWPALCPGPNCSPSVAFPTEACLCSHTAPGSLPMGSSSLSPGPLPSVFPQPPPGVQDTICPSSYDMSVRRDGTSAHFPGPQKYARERPE